MEHTKLSRVDASAAVTGLGWRYVQGEFRSEVQTGSLPLAADVAGRAAAVPGAGGHLRMDVRADRVIFALQTAEARATRPASLPGRAGTYRFGACWTSDQRAR
jgi:4a-hydroxytetrahydrobiopterin dehydratase